MNTTSYHQIPEANWPSLQAKLARLNKRAAKIGCEPVTAEVIEEKLVPVKYIGGAGAPEVPELRLYKIVKVTGPAPKFNGWALVAAVENLDGEPLFRAIPGYEVPVKWRKADPTKCDHCQTKRLRNETFLVLHETGTIKQVGRQCIKDFLGHKSPAVLANQAEYLMSAEELASAAEEEGWGGGGAGPRWFDLAEYLSWVAHDVRNNGFLSKAKAENPMNATCEVALRWMFPGKDDTRPVRTQEDFDLANAAAEWAAALNERTDLNDFLYNIALIGKVGACKVRLAGYAAAIVSAYQREMGKLEEAKRAASSTFQGTVGKRSTFQLTVTRMTMWETQYGWTRLYVMSDEQGNVYTWKASSGPMEQGKTYTVTGTVKAHENYKGVNQTVLTRCKVDGAERFQ